MTTHTWLRHCLLAAPAGLVLMTGAAMAQGQTGSVAAATEPSAATVQQIEAQIRAALADWVGPLPLPPRPVQVSAEGDHFRLLVPLGAPSPRQVRWTAAMQHDPQGHWTLTDFALSPGTIRLTNRPRAVSVLVEPGAQTGQVQYDPDARVASSADTAVRSSDLYLSTPNSSELVSLHVDAAENHTLISPADGRVDVARETALTGLRIAAQSRNERREFGASRLRLSLKLSGVSGARAQEVVRGGIATTVGAPQDLVALADAAADLGRAATLEITGENTYGLLDGIDSTLRKVNLGLAVDGAGGMLTVRATAGGEGLFNEAIAAQGMHDLLPARVAVTGAMTGVSTAVAARYLRLAITDRAPEPQDRQDLFANGIVFDVSELSVELAGSALSASGHGVLAGPGQFSGTAHVAVADIERVQAALNGRPDPQTRNLAAALIFMKGLGRSEANRTVWDVTYDGSRVLVNGQDVMALAQQLQH